MITKWSQRVSNPDLEYITKGEKEFIDERGKISNFELPEPINLIGYIDSKKELLEPITITQSKNKSFINQGSIYKYL